MLRHFLNSKIHRATVTDANLNYVGSITIDEEFLEKANDEITDFVKDQTNDLLDKTLFTASCEMKNGFSRSDA